jgi:putative ATP-dependent endonuclease of OLD family
MVEGWSEEILIPALARKMKKDGLITKDLTEAGVSIVNVASAEFIKFAKIFLRQKEPYLTLPVAIITDVDVPAYERELVVEHDDTTIIKAKKNEYRYIKLNKNEIEKQSKQKKEDKEKEFNNQLTKVFVTENWTLEYSLLMSKTFAPLCEVVLHGLYSEIDKTDYKKALAIKLYNKTLKKTEFAYRLANRIDPESDDYDALIKLDTKDQPIASLLKAIIYVCN